ncbi:unnamed protein product [Trichobilharzia regenti]|nr:unnamed protein product [Trichobilharzia regenti]
MKELLGFSAGEIYTLVKNCVEKHFLANKKRRLTSVGYDSGISHNPLSVCRDEDESLVPVRVEHGHRVSFLEPSMQQQNLDLQYRPGATSSDPLSYSVPFSPNYRIRQLNKTENDRRNRLSETTMFSDPSICERCFFKRKRSGVDVQLQVDTATDVDKIVIDEGCIDRNACNNTEDWENDDPRGGRSACRLRCRCWRRSRKPLSDISPLASPPSHLFHPINERLSSSILQEQDESTYWFTECSGDRNTQLNESYFPVDEDWVAATALIEEMMVKGSYVNSASASVSSSFHSTINPLDCTTSTCASVNVSDIDEDEIASKAEFLLREIGEHGTESTPFSFDLSPI